MTVTSLNLTTAGSIPADVSAVLINAPGADLTDAETAILKDYVANGGKLFVTTDFTTGTPNLDSVLADCGMARQPGLLIETDTDHYPYGYPQTYLLPKLAGQRHHRGRVPEHDDLHPHCPGHHDERRQRVRLYRPADHR